ncbi:MAG: MBL fold metallo-hydrolase [Planctomycetota bacterium]
MQKAITICISATFRFRGNSMASVLHVLDVGHGNSAVLMDDRQCVVVDAGPKTGLLEFLTSEGIDQIEAVLISHADKDHIEGLISVLESGMFGIRTVRLNSDLDKDSQLWGDLVFLLGNKDDMGELDFQVSLTPDNTGEFDTANVQIEVLAPSKAIAAAGPRTKLSHRKIITANGLSAVVRISREGGASTLLCGDVDVAGFQYMLDRKVDIKSDVLVYPHHGGRSGSDDVDVYAAMLCEHVQPKIILFSTGRGRYATPIPSVVATIRKCIPEIKIGCTQLSENCTASLPDVELKHLTGHYSAGRQKNQCCAGTVSLDLNSNPAAAVPLDRGHDEFIRLNVTHALCQRDAT